VVPPGDAALTPALEHLDHASAEVGALADKLGSFLERVKQGGLQRADLLAVVRSWLKNGHTDPNGDQVPENSPEHIFPRLTDAEWETVVAQAIRDSEAPIPDEGNIPISSQPTPSLLSVYEDA
jgi:hypothetical protein